MDPIEWVLTGIVVLGIVGPTIKSGRKRRNKAGKPKRNQKLKVHHTVHQRYVDLMR